MLVPSAQRGLLVSGDYLLSASYRTANSARLVDEVDRPALLATVNVAAGGVGRVLESR